MQSMLAALFFAVAAFSLSAQAQVVEQPNGRYVYQADDKDPLNGKPVEFSAKEVIVGIPNQPGTLRGTIFHAQKRKNADIYALTFPNPDKSNAQKQVSCFVTFKFDAGDSFSMQVTEGPAWCPENGRLIRAKEIAKPAPRASIPLVSAAAEREEPAAEDAPITGAPAPGSDD